MRKLPEYPQVKICTLIAFRQKDIILYPIALCSDEREPINPASNDAEGFPEGNSVYFISWAKKKYQPSGSDFRKIAIIFFPFSLYSNVP